MRNKLVIIGLILIIIFLLFDRRNTREPTIVEVTRDSIIRDSIYIVNDSIIKEIEYIDKQYDKKMDTIMSGDAVYQLRIFSEYINHYRGTAKDN